jgi:hypothetical protein
MIRVDFKIGLFRYEDTVFLYRCAHEKQAGVIPCLSEAQVSVLTETIC